MSTQAEVKAAHRFADAIDAFTELADLAKPWVGKFGSAIALHDAVYELKTIRTALRAAKVPDRDALSPQGKIDALVGAVCAYMENKSGVTIRTADLTCLVQGFKTSEAHAAHLSTLSAHRLQGLLRLDAGIRNALEARGIIVDFDNLDSIVRIARTGWLTRHGDIFHHVNEYRAMGRRCAYCRAVEAGTSQMLVPATAEHSGPRVVRNGVVQLQPRVSYVHEMCRPYWLAWTAIAARYKDEAEAIAADEAAGRNADPVPEEQALPPSLGYDKSTMTAGGQL